MFYLLFGALIEKVVVSFEGDHIPVLGNYVQSAQHIQSVIHPPLHVLKVQVHLSLLVDFQNLVRNLGASGFTSLDHFFKDLFGEEDKLFVL